MNRPYIDLPSFKYPQAGHNHSNFDNFILEELNINNTRLLSIGISALKSYSRQSIAQPFEVAKFFLQTSEWRRNYKNEDSNEQIDYYVDTRSVQVYEPRNFRDANEEALKPHIFSILAKIARTEGVFGVFRGLNATCLAKSATSVVQAWATSFLAAVCGSTDPQFVDIMHSMEPLKLLSISLAGCAVSAFVLSPLYVIKARMIASSAVTPGGRQRSLRWTIFNESFNCPIWVSGPTALSAFINQLVSSTSPLWISRYMNIDMLGRPRLFKFAKLGIELLGIAIKLPFETFASRSQLKYANIPHTSYLVTPYIYNGMLSNVWRIISGEDPLSSLYGGWRTEVIGLIGEWGYDALDEGKPEQEQF